MPAKSISCSSFGSARGRVPDPAASPRQPHRCAPIAHRRTLIVTCGSSTLKSSSPAHEDVGSPHSPRDIELVTQVSLDRWPRFAQQALAWGGPVSVAVYMPCPPDHPLTDAYSHYLNKLVNEFHAQSTAAAAACPSAAASAPGLTPATRSSAGLAAAAVATEPSLAVPRAQPRLKVTPVHALRFAREGALVLPGVVPPNENDDSQMAYEYLYPINALRNAALRAATCSHVWLVDADFIPSEGLRQALLAPSTTPKSSALVAACSGPDGRSLLESSDAHPRPVMWVVPAFELQRGAAAAAAGAAAAVALEEVPDSQAAAVPRTLGELAVCAAAGFPDGGGGLRGDRAGGRRGMPALRPFHCGRYPQPVPSINYDQWLDDAAGALADGALGRGAAGGGRGWSADYCRGGTEGQTGSQGPGSDADEPQWTTVPYHEYFEPYGVVRRDQVPAYDERFRGYGLNKVQHAYHLCAAGFEFRLLKRHFCVTVPHARSASYRAVFGTAADPQQRMRVERLYDTFKREMYDKYGYRYTAPANLGGSLVT